MSIEKYFIILYYTSVYTVHTLHTGIRTERKNINFILTIPKILFTSSIYCIIPPERQCRWKGSPNTIVIQFLNFIFVSALSNMSSQSRANEIRFGKWTRYGSLSQIYGEKWHYAIKLHCFYFLDRTPVSVGAFHSYADPLCDIKHVYFCMHTYKWTVSGLFPPRALSHFPNNQDQTLSRLSLELYGPRGIHRERSAIKYLLRVHMYLKC